MSNSIKISIVLIAALGVAIVAGLYAFSGAKGNQQLAENSEECAISPAKRTALDAAAQGEVAAFNTSEQPTPLPAVTFKDVNGVVKTMDDWKGRTVLMNLWATWCAPCRKEMPALQKLNAELGGDNFEVVAVSVDQGDADKPKGFYESIGLDTLGFYHDETTETLFTLKKQGLAFGLPATLLIDGSGCVLGALNGPAEWAGEDAKALVRAGL